MRGTHAIRVSNRRLDYRFEVHRNITVVRGDSGTGKTTLYEMIADYTRLGQSSGVQIACDKKCVALVDMDWRVQLDRTNDSIVFVDEVYRIKSSGKFHQFERVGTHRFTAGFLSIPVNEYLSLLTERRLGLKRHVCFCISKSIPIA